MSKLVKRQTTTNQHKERVPKPGVIQIPGKPLGVEATELVVMTEDVQTVEIEFVEGGGGE
jgi:hypothetical protein